MNKSKSRSPLYAAAEKAVERGATVAVLTYLDGEGCPHVVQIGTSETSPMIFAGMLVHAQLFTMMKEEDE